MTLAGADRPLWPRVFIALAFIVATLSAGLIGWRFGAATKRVTLPSLGAVPHYKLVNQLGQPVSSEQFKGKVQVVTFLFPYCTTYCPLIAAHLVGFERTLVRAGLQDKVAIVAFNVDPAGTGPKQMRAFMKEYGWNPRDIHWQYLTGAPGAVRRVVTGGFHIAYRKVSDDAPPGPVDKDDADALTPQPTVVNHLADTAHPGYDITHNDGLEVVDAKNRIRKIYDEGDMVSNGQLLRIVKFLLRGGAS